MKLSPLVYWKTVDNLEVKKITKAKSSGSHSWLHIGITLEALKNIKDRVLLPKDLDLVKGEAWILLCICLFCFILFYQQIGTRWL